MNHRSPRFEDRTAAEECSGREGWLRWAAEVLPEFATLDSHYIWSLHWVPYPGHRQAAFIQQRKPKMESSCTVEARGHVLGFWEGMRPVVVT